MNEAHRKKQQARAFAVRFGGRELTPRPRTEEELAAFHRRAEAEWGLESWAGAATIVMDQATGEHMPAAAFMAMSRRNTAGCLGRHSVAAEATVEFETSELPAGTEAAPESVLIGAEAEIR